MTELWMLFLALGLVGALSPVPHQTSEESLRSALNAVSRKQRSLNANAQAYYADLTPYGAAAVAGGGKLQRQQVVTSGSNAGNDEIDDNDESLAFIPTEGVGQLETIGDGYQHLNNKQFNRALMDYLQYTTEQQEAPIQSMFREREHSGGGHKRAGNNNAGAARLTDKDLAMLLEDIDSDLLEDPEQPDDEDYERTLQMIYDKYKNQRDYGNAYGEDQYLLSKILADDEREEEPDPRYVQVPLAERRNVNARYPLFTRDYKNFRDVYKRFPVSKRSAKAMNKKRQTTDPKVAQDLGGLFGTQSTETVNHTHEHEHEHEHEHDHEHNHAKNDNHSEHSHDHSSQSSNQAAAKSNNKNVKESIAKANKTNKERPIEVKKKSVDWSQYFGIDRRKKKAVYMARPGTQDQDDEYLLQKYYEIMAENLNPMDKDNGEKRDKLHQMDSKLRNMKNLMIEEAVQLGSKNNMDDEEVKEDFMSRLAAAYSLEKLRRALYELSRDAAAQREKAAQAQNNLTANHPVEGGPNEDKRNRNAIADFPGAIEEMNCPQVDIIERRCKATEALIGDFRQVLRVPCVLYHVCNACEQDECLERFAVEAEKICEEEDTDDSPASKKHCIQAAMLLPRYAPSISRSDLCRSDEEDICIAHYQNRYQQQQRSYLFNNNPLYARHR